MTDSEFCKTHLHNGIQRSASCLIQRRINREVAFSP